MGVCDLRHTAVSSFIDSCAVIAFFLQGIHGPTRPVPFTFRTDLRVKSHKPVAAVPFTSLAEAAKRFQEATPPRFRRDGAEAPPLPPMNREPTRPQAPPFSQIHSHPLSVTSLLAIYFSPSSRLSFSCLFAFLQARVSCAARGERIPGS